MRIVMNKRDAVHILRKFVEERGITDPWERHVIEEALDVLSEPETYYDSRPCEYDES